MMYRVILDGNDILNFQDKRYLLLNPALEMEVNTAGSFTFSMHPSHTFYSDLSLLIPTIEVYEDEELIWTGRPVEIKTDFFKNKEVYCEGALAYFNDTIQRPREFNSIRVHEFFRYIVDAHNAQVAPSRQFTVGELTVNNNKVYRNLRYESTFDVIKRQCLNAEGGYLFIRREEGVNYIDWLAEMPDSTNQPVEFGLNLLDISSSMDGSSIVTCVVPLGEVDQETGKYLTVESVNEGSDTIESEAVATFGRITKSVEFTGVFYPDTLYEDGLEYLASKQFDDMTIECSAAELHAQNPSYKTFRIGQLVRCHSVPHLLDRIFPLIRMSVSLDTAAKKITLGSVKASSLTEVTKDISINVDSTTNNVQDIDVLVNNVAYALDQITHIPELSDMVSSVDMELDSIRNMYESNDFQAMLADALSNRTPDMDKLLADLGFDPSQTISLGDLTARLNQELDSYKSQFDGAGNYGDFSSVLKDLDSMWTDRSSIYGGSSDYGDISSFLSGLNNETDAILNGGGSLLDVNTRVNGMMNTMNSLSLESQQCMASINMMQGNMQMLEQRIAALEASAGWIHQINGAESGSGVVNFVTTV